MKVKKIASLITVVSIASLILLMSTTTDEALKLFSSAFLDNQVLLKDNQL